MALNLLAIPAMSLEVERLFSSIGLMLTDRRNRLKEDVRMLLQSSLNSQLFLPIDIGLAY